MSRSSWVGGAGACRDQCSRDPGFGAGAALRHCPGERSLSEPWTSEASCHLRGHDEIGRPARAVQNFRAAVAQVFELEQLELNLSKQRDAAMAERDAFNDKYQAQKRQLSAAINSMSQGLIMLDGKDV
ncbi:hypothetical protein ACFQX9_14670 [Bradyrhizobium sp. GCM10028915]|uniref:hypothetical protein n=1 Tax=Bradyrhizobium sp. GCM10028915 TaxID=3273385 RepID=UPI003617F6B5